MKKLVHVCVGCVLGITAVLACSDDSPPRADAAACDCPLVEPPIASRIVEVIQSTMLPPSSDNNGRDGGGVVCPPGSILITGGCMGGIGQVPDVVLEQNSPVPREGSSGNAWNCSWRNNTNQQVEVRAIARCLMAAQ